MSLRRHLIVPIIKLRFQLAVFRGNTILRIQNFSSHQPRTNGINAHPQKWSLAILPLSTSDPFTGIFETRKASPTITPNSQRCKEYQELREKDKLLVANYDADTLMALINDALKSESFTLIDQIVQDVIDVNYAKYPSRIDVLVHFLAHGDPTTLQHETAFNLLRQVAPYANRLRRTTVVHFIRLLSDSKLPDSQVEPYLKLITPVLVSHLQRLPAAPLSSANYKPPFIVRVAFQLIRQMLQFPALRQEVIDIFQQLVNNGQLPLEAVHDTDGAEDPFNIVIVFALIKACLHWDWRPPALRLLADLLVPRNSGNEPISTLALNTIDLLLESPTESDLRFCTWAIIKIHNLFDPVPNIIIHKFYNYAAKRLAVADAENMFAFTRDPDVLHRHRYPAPQGAALNFLMRHLATTSRRLDLTRILASDVIDDDIALPVQSRARFITLVATQGYSKFARILWDKYSTGKEKRTVVANPTLLIRMTSLFMNRITALGRQEESPSLIEAERAAIEEESEDSFSFVGRIMEEFRISHEPMAEAPHLVLTTYARACFIVGKFAEGFETFKHLLNRKEVPDMHDVNVALSAVAEQSPRLAARMIRRMLAKGLPPDAITFGTVLHRAINHNDKELVDEMISRIKEMKDVKLSLKTVTGLVRANMYTGNDDSPDTKRTKLKDTLNILGSLTEANLIASPQTGKFLVATALQVEDPEMAFTFWKLLVRVTTDWNGKEHITQRRQISYMLRRHRDDGLLPESRKVQSMLLMLRQSPIK